jgi:hypothetical protein
MKSRITALIAGLALGSSLLFASAGIATAASPFAGLSGTGVCAAEFAALKTPSIAALRAFGDCEINRRFATLSDLSARIAASKVMTGSHAAALQAGITSTRSGLTDLKSTIDAETSIPALQLDIANIAANYRVYLLVVPQANLINAADGVLSAQTRFATVNANLAARIAAARADGKDTTAAQADLDAMNASVAAAVGLADPLAAQLLPLTPAQYDSGSGRPILTAARTALGHARDDLRSAIASARACRDALE